MDRFTPFNISNADYFIEYIYNDTIYYSNISTNSKFNSIISPIIQNLHNKKRKRFIIIFFITHFNN